MSLSLAKLQQLKRQAGASSPARPAAPAPAPAARTPDLDQLRRLLRVRARPQAVPAGGDRQLPGEQVAPGLYLVEEHLPDDALPDWFDGSFDRGEAIDPAELLFFDTETTGLAGGTGMASARARSRGNACSPSTPRPPAWPAAPAPAPSWSGWPTGTRAACASAS